MDESVDRREQPLYSKDLLINRREYISSSVEKTVFVWESQNYNRECKSAGWE
jgi:hypothetical protein